MSEFFNSLPKEVCAESTSDRRTFLTNITKTIVGALYAATNLNKVANGQDHAITEEVALAEVPDQQKVIFEKNGCKVMAVEEGKFSRFTVCNAKGDLIYEAVTKVEQFKSSKKEGEIGEFTLNNIEIDLDSHEVIYEDGTLKTEVIQRGPRQMGKVIRQVVQKLNETTKTIIPYSNGVPTELVVKQVFDIEGNKMEFHFYDKNGTVLFVKKNMDIEMSQRRKPDGSAVPSGRVKGIALPDGKILEIRGKGGYVITYKDFKLGTESNGELYIAYDDGPIAYTFFHPDNPDRPDSIIMRSGEDPVRKITYDAKGTATGLVKVAKPKK